MAMFITRIELHDANSEDYTKLHSLMEQSNFKRFIVSSNSIKYELPTAEYHYEGQVDRTYVFNLANTAALKIGKKFGVITVEYIGATWDGLPIIN